MDTEQIYLDGWGYLLIDKNSNNDTTNQFLKELSKCQDKIDQIHRAIEEGDIDQFIILIDNNKFSTARDKFGMTPLHIAVLHGQTNAVRYLLANYPSCINATNHTGRAALHYAFANHANKVIIKMLQKAGADDSIKDKFDHEPLYYRNEPDQLDMKMLIKDTDQMDELIAGQMNGALLQDLEKKISEWIYTSNLKKLDVLVLNGYADLLMNRKHTVNDPCIRSFLKSLSEYQGKIDAIHKAIEANNLHAVKVLIDRKKMAFCRDIRHLTPLHKAIILGHIGIAKFIIKNYPQVVNAMDDYKRTPLHYAATLSDGRPIYKLMRDVGADSKIFDCIGRQPIFYLKNQNKIDLKEIKMGKETNLNENDYNCLKIPCLKSNIRQWIHDGNIGKLEQLVLSGCGDLLFGHTTDNPDSNNFLQYLETYLNEIDKIHETIKKGDLKNIQELLIRSKKLAVARNRFGHTPLHTAIIYEQTRIIRYIASNFPFVLNASDYNNRTAMHYAAATHDGGHYMKILIKAGADSEALDDAGHKPYYYSLRNVINLELLKEINGNDENVDNSKNSISDEFTQLPDYILSSGSSSATNSPNISTSRSEPDESDDQFKFEFDILNEKNIPPTTSNDIYLARTTAPILNKALSEVLLQQPIDPIIFIANWLIHYREQNPL